jgi:hypothetical protein
VHIHSLPAPITFIAAKFIIGSGTYAWRGWKEELAVIHFLRKYVAIRVRGALAGIIKLHVK